ncbi:hypothetical protein GCM10009551_006970 [Nocardiopsis tropica]
MASASASASSASDMASTGLTPVPLDTGTPRGWGRGQEKPTDSAGTVSDPDMRVAWRSVRP